MKTIYDIFEMLFGYNEAQLKKLDSPQKINDIKYLLIYCLYFIYHLRPTVIQKEFGYKSHQSIYYAIKLIQGLKKVDKKTKENIDLVEFILI